MSDHDTDARTEHDSEQPAQDEPEQDRAEKNEDDKDEAHQKTEKSDDSRASVSGVVVEGYETQNTPREETQALLEADTPDDVDDDLLTGIEEERKRRLDPENRPDNAEIDNTKRVFLPAEGRFEDSDIDQDPSLGQEGMAPVGGGGGDSDSDSDSQDSGESEHAEPDVESGDPKDDSTTTTSGTPDPTASDTDSGSDSRSSRGKHRA